MYDNLSAPGADLTPGPIVIATAKDTAPPPRSFTRFMKGNKAKRENTFYPATKSLMDEEGKPLEWEIRPLSTAQNNSIRTDCTMEVPVTGKPHLYRPRLDTDRYMAKMLAASVVYPNLLDAELQDSYGVNRPEDLLQEMIDNPGEYQDFSTFVSKFNGFNVSFDDLVEEAKN